MFIWLGGGLVLLAGVLGARWRSARADSLGRRNAFPGIRVGLCLLLGTGALADAALHARTEQRLSAVASGVAGVRVRVHCQGLAQAFGDLGPELGLVRFGADGVPEHQTLIKWETCRHLAAWLRSGKERPDLDEVVAVHVLTHETMHMAGSTDEALTECRAVQRDARTARQLGATPAQARALAIRYWREVYPRMPDAYRTAGCGPGGSLDEHLPDPPWA